MIFRAGDKVRCVREDTTYDLHVGNVYTIKEMRLINEQRPNLGGNVVLEGQPDLLWNDDRFEIVDVPPSPFISSFKSDKMTLPTDSNARKDYPLFRGLLRYFPAALAGVSRTSKLGNDKHNPGEEMHHARGKSPDHGDCIIRHMVDVEDLLAAFNRNEGSVTAQDVLNEANQMVWRALAYSQELHEKFGAPMAPGAKK